MNDNSIMRSGYAFLVIISLLLYLLLRAERSGGDHKSLALLIDSDCRLSLSSEDCFAKGLKFPFARAETYDLQLVSGVSDQLSEALLRHKLEIIAAAKATPPEETYKAFSVAPGIGPKRAETLYQYFSLTSD
jgi:hypothetical protein